MAHRLIACTCRVDWIVKNGLVTGNFNSLAQVQPRYSDFRRFLSQSSNYFSQEPPKTFERPPRPKKGKSSRGAKMDKKENTEKKKIDNKPKSPPKSARKSPNQGSKTGGNGGGGGNRKKNSPGSFLEKDYVGEALFFLGFIGWVLGMVVKMHQKTYKEINYNDYFNYLAQGRVAKVDNTYKNWLRILIAPGSSGDDAETVWLKLDSLYFHKNEASVTNSNTFNINVEHKNEAPSVRKKKGRK